MLPNVVVIDAMKAGTTSLYRYLRASPGLHAGGEGAENRGRAALGSRPGWYEALFAGAGGPVAVGGASPIHAMYPAFTSPGYRTPSRRRRHRCDLVDAVRHPIERMRSHYLHQVAQRREHAPIEHSLTASALPGNQPLRHADRAVSRRFPPERLQVITAEKRKRRILAEAVLRVPGSRALRRASRRPLPPPAPRDRRLGIG